MDDRPQLYDLSSVVSFTADDIEDAEAQMDDLLDLLEEKGFSVQQASLEEAVLMHD